MEIKIACLLSLALIASAIPVDVNQGILEEASEAETRAGENPMDSDEGESEVMFCVPVNNRQGNAQKSKREFDRTRGRGFGKGFMLRFGNPN